MEEGAEGLPLAVWANENLVQFVNHHRRRCDTSIYLYLYIPSYLNIPRFRSIVKSTLSSRFFLLLQHICGIFDFIAF
jgi:hypothetical protein